jgi:hypothetical protein
LDKNKRGIYLQPIGIGVKTPGHVPGRRAIGSKIPDTDAKRSEVGVKRLILGVKRPKPGVKRFGAGSFYPDVGAKSPAVCLSEAWAAYLRRKLSPRSNKIDVDRQKQEKHLFFGYGKVLHLKKSP